MSVKLSTIKNTLGESDNTLSALCKSSRINKWSRHKPYAVKKYAPLEEEDIAGVFFGLEVPIVEMNNITPASQTTTWKRLGPSSIFRLSDFDGYVHTAESPFISLSGVTNLEFQKNKYYSFSLNIRTNQTSGSILVKEFKPHNTLHSFDVPLSDCYLGIALYRNNNASEWNENKSSICQWAYCSSKTIGENSIVSIPSVTFDDVSLVDYSSRFYLVFFLTPKAFTSFTIAPSSDSALTNLMAVLEGGIYPVKITGEPEQFPVLWEGSDSDYYTIGIYNNSVSVSIINLETPNEIDSFVNAEVSIDKAGGRFSLNPTSDMENLAYYADSSITERRVRFSIFGIEGWIGNYIPKFTENDLANNCEFYPIIQYYDVDGIPVYFGIVYEYKGSSTLSVTTYTWERYIAFYDGSNFYGTTQIDTISYSVDDSGHTTETSIIPITKVLIQQNMNVSTGDWTGIQVEVYQGTIVTETNTNISYLVIPTDVSNGAVTFGIDTQYERWYSGSKAYNPITNRVGTFNLQLRIQDRL